MTGAPFVLIAGGGTGGHTSAGLAVAAALTARPGVRVEWVGSHHGIEARRVPEADIPYHAIATGKLRRYWAWRNVPDLTLRVPAGLLQAVALLARLRPDVLFATGGFVSLPPALAARFLRIPVIVHEQTAVPGLANRIAGRFARRVALTFPLAAPGRPSGRIVVTGNPLRPELRGGSAERLAHVFGFETTGPGATVPLVYVTGGSLGSHRINRAVGAALIELLPHARIVHQCGDSRVTGDLDWLEDRAHALPADLVRRYAPRAYLDAELAHVYAVASLVVGRSGAGTVNECCHLGLPAVYVPLPGTSGDEQTANARLVEAAGGAVVLPQAALTPERLRDAVLGLLADPARLREMGARARTLAVADAEERLARLILEAADR